MLDRFRDWIHFVVAKYFRACAKRAYRRWHPRTICVTGSVGKTTMLHLLASTLGDRAHCSYNANSMFGISFDVLGLQGVTGSKLRWLYLFVAAPIRAIYFKHKEPYYVVEIDADRPHGAEFIASWINPEVTLWVSLDLSHANRFDTSVRTGEFEDLEHSIAHEFAMLPEYTGKRVYIDGDTHKMITATRKVKENHDLSYTIVPCYKSDLTKYAVYPDQTEFSFGKTVFHFNHPMPPDMAIQLVMLQKLCSYLKIPLKTDFSDFVTPPGRSSYFAGINGLKLIDSSYNAQFASVVSVFDMLKAMPVKHKWLVMGDMVEQGSYEAQAHQDLADLIIKLGPEQVILVGKRLKKYTEPILKKQGVKLYSTTSQQQALSFIKKHATHQETILFKGSQYLEWIIEQLLADPADAAKLPRREKAAVKRREKRGLK